jgi:hypothetical protein
MLVMIITAEYSLLHSVLGCSFVLPLGIQNTAQLQVIEWCP